MTNGASAVRIEKDIVFAKGAKRDLKLDVYHPAANDKATAVIHLHGGGFRGGDKDGVRLASLLAQRGYVCVASQYSLAAEASWPACIQDVKAAIRWTRANASSLGIDPARIVIMGYSAGANLSLTAAGTPDLAAFEGDGGNAGVSSAVAACIAFYPPDVMRRQEDGSDHLLLPGGSDEDYRGASPISHVKAGYPPTMLLHSTADTTVPFDASMRLFAAMQDAGVASELHVFQGLSHVFDRHPEFAAPCAEIIDRFLDRTVVEPRDYPPLTGGATPTPAAASA